MLSARNLFLTFVSSQLIPGLCSMGFEWICMDFNVDWIETQFWWMYIEGLYIWNCELSGCFAQMCVTSPKGTERPFRVLKLSCFFHGTNLGHMSLAIRVRYTNLIKCSLYSTFLLAGQKTAC